MIDLEMFEKSTPTPDLTPMIDMIFLLLIFFMLTSVFQIPGMKTHLPESETALPVEQNEIVLTITADNKIYIEKEQIELKDLEAYLSDQFAQVKENTVVIASDKLVTFERIVSVMDSANKAGAESITFLTEAKSAVQ